MSLAKSFHLAKRFVTSLWPGPPSSSEDAWARCHLTEGEQLIWKRMSKPDRRHAIGVARAVAGELGPAVGRPVVAAALMHDCGKVISDFGTFARVGATLIWSVADRSTAFQWADTERGLRRRLALYRLHPELGSRLLVAAGADPLTAAWAAEHHLPPDAWTVRSDAARVLAACDND